MIDFKREITKVIRNTNEKAEIFNKVIKDNLDNVKELFKNGEFKLEIEETYDIEGYIVLKFIFKKEGYESRHYFQHVRNSSDDISSIRENTESKFKNFIVRLAINKGIKYN